MLDLGKAFGLDQIFELSEILELVQTFKADWDFSLVNQAFGVGSDSQTGLKFRVLGSDF